MNHIKHPRYKGRTLKGVAMLAQLIGYDVTEDGILLLSPEQQKELEVYAESVHLRASDNLVHVPPRPTWLPEKSWAGPYDEEMWGNAPTPVDCAAIAAATRSAA